VIEAVGPGVPRSREGEAVWLWNTQWQRPFGTAAHFAVVPSTQAVALPSNVNFELGSALGVPALTAHRCVAALGTIRDRHILIHGGAGVIGQFAIQIAKARGAVVCATVSDRERARFAMSAGADHVLNYRTDSFLDEATSVTGGHGFDHILDVDMGANGRSYTDLLRKHGSVVIFGSASNMRPQVDVLPLQLHGVTLHFVSGSEQRPDDRASAIEEVTHLLQEGRLSMKTEARYGLQDVAAAHERVEAGRLTGKVLLDLSGRY
jgi:NADPH:quinone reductase